MASKENVEQEPLRAELPIAVDLKKLHPRVQATFESLIPRDQKRRDGFNVAVSEKLVHRAIMILEAVVRLCESHGFLVKPPAEAKGLPDSCRPEYCWFQVGDGCVSVYLMEAHRRVVRKSSLGFGDHYDYEATGHLCFVIEPGGITGFRGRRRWEDRINKSLETWVLQIVRQIEVVGPRVAKQVEMEIEEEQLRKRATATSNFFSMLRGTQEAAIRRLIEDGRRLTAAQALREYTAHVEEHLKRGEIEISDDVVAWLRWSQFVAAEIDPIGLGEQPWKDPYFRRLVLDLAGPV